MVASGRLPYRFHPEARREFDRQIEWFADENLDVAQDFLDVSHARIDDVRWMPYAYSPYLHGTRKAGLGPYPLRLIYRVKEGVVQIIAFAHTSRRPGYWRERLDDDI
ncbi:MAG: type II toxin-antitoxin system RelE/ParE family toxin [Planctomycetota bacterium]